MFNQYAKIISRLASEEFKPGPIESAGPKADGWIDPNGAYWPVPKQGHFKFAMWYYTSRREDHGADPVANLEKRGWVHISSGTVIIRKEPTNRQKDAIYDWMKSIGGKADFYGFYGNTGMDTNKFLDHYAFLSKRKIV